MANCSLGQSLPKRWRIRNCDEKNTDSFLKERTHVQLDVERLNEFNLIISLKSSFKPDLTFVYRCFVWRRIKL